MYLNYGKAAHNTFIEIFYELGLCGGILYVYFFISLIKEQYKKDDKTLFFLLVALTVKLFFLSALDNRCVWGAFCWATVSKK